jgi:hypothetical protein
LIFGNSENNDNEQLIISSDRKNKNFKSNFFEMNLNEFNNNLLNQNNEVKLSALFEIFQIDLNSNIAKANKQNKKRQIYNYSSKKSYRTTKVKKANQMIGKNFSRKFCDKNIKTKIKNHYITFLLTSLMK